MMTTVRHKALLIVCLALTISLIAASAASAGEVFFKAKVYESTFDEFANKIEPLTFNGYHKEFFCKSSWTAVVDKLDFKITESKVKVGGKVKCTWCDITVNLNLDADVSVKYSEEQQAVVVVVESAPISYKKTFWTPWGEEKVVIPLFDAAPYLTVPPLPIRSGVLLFKGVNGGDYIITTPLNPTIELKNGYLLFRTPVRVGW